jgi:16S rRNA (adenine1518-N6/adenine1519-N6)-dimethyltransferase
LYPVRAKKHLGQHFLNDENIAKKITESLKLPCDAVLEVGPGTGVLTKYLLEMLEASAVDTNEEFGKVLRQFLTLDVDRDSISYLKETYPEHA